MRRASYFGSFLVYLHMLSDYFWSSALRYTIRKNKRARENSYCHLATLSSDGLPSNRTVVFRGLVVGTDALKVVTDTRSRKVQELRYNPVCEVSWYFAATREQFRIKARAEICSQSKSPERIESWSKLGEQAKTQFFWPSPGRACDPEKNVAQLASIDLGQPPDSFTLLILHPFCVDHLQLKGNPQIRRVSVFEDAVWKVSAVNP